MQLYNRKTRFTVFIILQEVLRHKLVKEGEISQVLCEIIDYKEVY